MRPSRPTVEMLMELPLPEDPKERRRHFAELRAARRRAEWDRRVRRWGRRASDVYGFAYQGALRTVQFPFYSLDLLDRYGKPDHSKIGPFIVSQELIAICAYDVVRNGHPLQATIVVVIAVLSFASASLMRLFLQKTKVDITSSTTVEDKTQRTIIERRDPATGTEPTP